MDLPFKINEKASILLAKTNFNQFVEKISSKNYENLLKNHDLKHICVDNDIALQSLKDWKSEDVDLNSTTTGFMKNITANSLNFVDVGEYSCIGVNNVSDEKLYQNFIVNDLNTSENLTVVAIYKLAKYNRFRGGDPNDYVFDKYVQKGYKNSLDPQPDLLMDVYKTASQSTPIQITDINMTGANCKFLDSLTFMDVKQYTLSDNTFKNLTFKVSNTTMTTFSEDSDTCRIIPAIIGFYIYNANMIVPGLLENISDIEGDIKYEDGKWQLTNDGVNFKSLLDYQEVKVGSTQDAEFATLSLAKAHASNSGKKRKYILTSNINESGNIIFSNDTEIDGRGFTISGAQNLNIDRSSTTDGTSSFVLKNINIVGCVLDIWEVSKIFVENVKITKTTTNGYDLERVVIIANSSGYFNASLNCDSVSDGHTVNNHISNPISLTNCSNLNIVISKIENYGKWNENSLALDAYAFYLDSCTNVNIKFNQVISTISALTHQAYDLQTNVNLAMLDGCTNCSIEGEDYTYTIIDTNPSQDQEELL